jgi:hypothetical protein
MCKTTADQHPHGALCVSRIPSEQRNRFPEVLCVPVEYRWSKNQTGCSPQNSPVRGNPNSGATFCRAVPGTTSHGNGAPERRSCGLFPPRWSKLLCGKSFGGFNLPTVSLPTCHFAYEIGKLIHKQKDTKCKMHFAYGAKCLCVIWPTKFL